MSGITTKHSQVSAYEEQQQRCRDVCDGSDAVKAKGTKYLPELSGQSTEEYQAYKLRAYWFGGTERTHQGLVGRVFRKDPTWQVPTVLAPVIHDITLQATPARAFAHQTLSEVLKVGRYGVLVDMPRAEADQPRPYLIGYRAEQIVNWQTDMIDGLSTLTRVVLCEYLGEADPADPYVTKTLEQYRELYLEDGVYHVQLWRKQKQLQRGTDEWVRYEDAIIPVIKGEPFSYIPFCFFGPSGTTPDIDKPPILDLCDAHLSLYRTAADLEHARHFTALPTPWVTGLDNKAASLKIGSMTAWLIPPADAKVGMLEFTGQGLGALENAIKDKKQDMAILGARLLEERRPAVEAADTLAMRNSGEQSILRSVALTVGQGLSQCLEWCALMLGVKPEQAQKSTCQLNLDFADAQMTFAELSELVKSWQSGAISYQTMYNLMEKGEIARPGISAKKEQAEIEIERPAQIPQNINPLTGLPDPEQTAG